ncbi:MAG: hypothetical protein R6U96_03460 [Promethearchaeia archaeon]
MKKSKHSEYKFKCVQCGNCCRQGWYVPIFKEDLLVWKQESRTGVYKNLQVDPRKISIIGLNNSSWKSEWDEDFMAYVRNNPEKCAKLIDIPKTEKIYDFLFNHHEYMGEGKHRKHKALGDIYLFPRPYKWSWPKFVPKDFQTTLHAMDLGLSYIAQTDPTGDCIFLEDSLCVLHPIKPIACQKFPYRRIDGKWTLEGFEGLLKICKGLKKK